MICATDQMMSRRRRSDEAEKRSEFLGLGLRSDTGTQAHQRLPFHSSDCEISWRNSAPSWKKGKQCNNMDRYIRYMDTQVRLVK